MSRRHRRPTAGAGTDFRRFALGSVHDPCAARQVASSWWSCTFLSVTRSGCGSVEVRHRPRRAPTPGGFRTCRRSGSHAQRSRLGRGRPQARWGDPGSGDQAGHPALASDPRGRRRAAGARLFAKPTRRGGRVGTDQPISRLRSGLPGRPNQRCRVASCGTQNVESRALSGYSNESHPRSPTACRTRSPRPRFLPAPSVAAGCSTAS